MEFYSTKMKDSEPPTEFYGRLQTVPLGWLDEDGQEINGAVFAIENNPPPKAKRVESELSKEIKKLTNSWWSSGAETRENLPYISRSALMNYLTINEGLTESTAKTYVKESKKGRMIYNLLTAQIIKPYEHGWLIISSDLASQLALRASGDRGHLRDK